MGWNLKDALLKPVRDDSCYDHLGNKFKNTNEMCEYYHIDSKTFFSRKSYGYSLKDCLINLYGHTHQTTKFYNEMPFMYNVGLDCHQNKPISIDEIISDCEEKVKECYKLLED